jgi:hypothetical protein
MAMDRRNEAGAEAVGLMVEPHDVPFFIDSPADSVTRLTPSPPGAPTPSTVARGWVRVCCGVERLRTATMKLVGQVLDLIVETFDLAVVELILVAEVINRSGSRLNQDITQHEADDCLVQQKEYRHKQYLLEVAGLDRGISVVSGKAIRAPETISYMCYTVIFQYEKLVLFTEIHGFLSGANLLFTW